MTCKRHSKVIDLFRPRWCLAVLRSSAGTFGLQKLHSIIEVLIGDCAYWYDFCINQAVHAKFLVVELDVVGVVVSCQQAAGS